MRRRPAGDEGPGGHIGPPLRGCRSIQHPRTGRDRARPLPVMIGRFKSYTDHGYRGLTDKKTPGLWQRGFYDHVIRNDADLDVARCYVRNNPVKKQERESIYAEKETTQ